MDGRRNQHRSLLLTPGPTPTTEAVLSALAEPLAHHRTKAFESMFERVQLGLKELFQTQQSVLILTATGSGAMEAAVTNLLCKGEPSLFLVSGKFGERWYEMAIQYGILADPLCVEFGSSCSEDAFREALLRRKYKAIFTQVCETSTGSLHDIAKLRAIADDIAPETLFVVDAITAIGAIPLPMDALKLDGVVAGSQKAFMIPTGLSFISLSERAWAAAEQSNIPKYYFNLLKEKKAHLSNQTLFSSPVTLIKALATALDRFKGGGLNDRIRRSEALRDLTLDLGSDLGLEAFSNSPSPSVTALRVKPPLRASILQRRLEEDFGVVIMAGQDSLKDTLIRIGHMGYIQNTDMAGLFHGLFEVLREERLINKMDEITPNLTQYDYDTLLKFIDFRLAGTTP